jgi:glycosyltransferase involved in cell wall biosynthesis
MTDLSIIVPIFNEEENIQLLYKKVRDVFKDSEQSWELIYINDGSVDESEAVLERIAEADRRVKVISFRRNFGQTAAMMAGIDFAEGGVVIPIDGDLQNDPADIPLLLDKLSQGYDVVSGWRKNRKDNPLKRTLPSRIANWLISRISGVRLHDYGCTLKAYRREVIKDVKLYGEMHRFIPIYAGWEGARVTEITVRHHKRRYGKSKYGINRTFKVVLDLIVIKFLAKYSQKPIHMFGSFGLLCFFFAFLTFLLMLYYKFFGDKDFVETPLPLLVIMLAVIGFQSIFLGLIAEIQNRIYHESQQKRIYRIKKTTNIEA